MKVRDLVKIHESKCPHLDPCKRVQISCDGLSECRSTSNSMDVYSLRFRNCGTVYPYAIVRPLDKYKVKSRPYLQKFIEDLKENNITIKQFVGDKLKRSDVKETLGHSSYFACEYCIAKATSFVISDKKSIERKKQIESQIRIIDQKINALDNDNDLEEIENLNSIKVCLEITIKELSSKKSQVVWPSSTMNKEPRTKESVLAIIEQMKENGDMTRDEKKGIVGESCFLDLDYFDFVIDIPAEYLHSMCLGVSKRLVELTFNVGVTRPRNTQRKLTPISELNELIIKIKVVSDFARRARSLDYSVWKGQEFRNLCLFMYPLVIDCLEEDAEEKKLWLLFAYMFRACILPQNEFRDFDLNIITYCCTQFYKLFEKLFSARNCSYNVHVVLAHLIEIRAHGPLTMTSAFGFEHFYGEIRHSFVPGTVSPLKQVMEKVLLKRAIGHHTCESKIKFKTEETSLECDNLIYTFRNQSYNFYKITEIDGDHLHCVKITTKEKFYPCVPNLKWELVGHFELDEITNEKKSIEAKFAGKVIKINENLITCPRNILIEK